MSQRAMLRRGTTAAVARMTFAVAIAVIALGETAGSADAAANPYPPTVPCALSVSTAPPSGASGAVELAVRGSGLGSLQQVDVTFDPPALRVGSFRTDDVGGFRGVITVSAARVRVAQRVTATSPTASCSAPTPRSVPTASAPSAPGTSSSASGSVAPSNRPSAGPSVAVSQAGSSSTLALSLWITLAVAVGLVLIGGLAMLLLTRRSE